MKSTAHRQPLPAESPEVAILPYPGCDTQAAMHALLQRLANSDASLLNHPVADIAHEAKALLATLSHKDKAGAQHRAERVCEAA